MELQAPGDSGSPLSTPPIPKRRNYESCHRCRHDKQRCEPANRDWTNMKEKCGRCGKYGYDCGPPEKARKKAKLDNLPSTGPTARSDEVHIAQQQNVALKTGHIGEQTNLGYPAPPATSHRQGAPPEARAFQITRKANQYPPATEFDAKPLNACVEPDSRPSSNDAAIEQVRRSIAKLGDQIAASELLKLEMEIWTRVEGWVGPKKELVKFRAAVQVCLDGVLKCFDSEMADALRYSMGIRDEPCHEMMFEQILRLQHQHDCLLRTADTHFGSYHRIPYTMSAMNNEWIRWFLHDKRSRQGICSNAEFLLGNVWRTLNGGPLRHAGSTSLELSSLYTNAALDIARALGDVVFEDGEMQELILRPRSGSQIPISACHLAARQSSSQVLCEILEKSKQQSSFWEKDMFGRTPVHVAAYADNVQALRNIFEASCITNLNPEDSSVPWTCSALVDLDPDVLGMTPLMISACRDDLKSFQLLWRYGADAQQLHDGRSVLALAARNGSSRIVKYILSSEHIPYSPTPALIEAITAGQRHIIQAFLSHFEEQARKGVGADNNLEIEAGIFAAEKNGLPEIAAELRSLSSRVPSRQQAIDGIQNLHYDQADFEQADYGMASSFGLSQHYNPVAVQELESFSYHEADVAWGYDVHSLMSSDPPQKPLNNIDGGLDWLQCQHIPSAGEPG